MSTSTSSEAPRNRTNGTVSRGGRSPNGAAASGPGGQPAPQMDLVPVDAVQNGEPVAVPSLGSVLKGVAATVTQTRSVVRETAVYGTELTKIVVGRSQVEPRKGDRRFADPAWSGNPLFHRIEQSYLAAGQSLSRLVDDLETGNADWHTVEKARFAVDIAVSALSPTNLFATNPAAIKKAFDTGGKSVLRGLRNWAGDVRHNGGMPSQTDRSAFTVGKELAITPGAVIHRDDIAEIIHYTPSTPTVYQRPLLIVPPPIGRYYFLDLRPNRSFIEHAVSQGLQVFLVSWRNPGKEQSNWGLDDYAKRILSSIDIVRGVADSPDVNLLGFCAGGILSTTVLNHLAGTGDDRVHSASFGVMLLDFGVRAPLGTFSSTPMLALAKRNSAKKGAISGQSLGKVFSWMRPDDLVFNYWVNNYLLGQDPPVFDILAWNADSTNLPAKLHEQFLGIFKDNLLCKPGAMTVLGTPIDLARIDLPVFVTGALTDHLTPWKGCYRTTELFTGETTFVLSNAGHIASLVNPPGNPKASYFEGGPVGTDSETWRQGAVKREGTWWTAWAEWITPLSGERRAAPVNLGNNEFPVIEPAPGRYVRAAVKV